MGSAERADGFFRPPGSYAIEISLENSPYLRLPAYRNAITSLAVVDDTIVGGTTASNGTSPFVFIASLRERRLTQIVDIETIAPGQRALASGFARARDGALIVGTLPRAAGATGHLLQIATRTSLCVVRDLGAPVDGEGVFAVAVDLAGGRVYGLTHPTGRFFVCDLAGRRATVFDDTAPDAKARAAYAEFALKPEQTLSRRLAIDAAGRVYGSAPLGRFFRFDPRTNQIEFLGTRLPALWDHDKLARVDAWTLAPDGSLYGGNAADGLLFRVDPETAAVQNLGKPIAMPRIKGLAFAADGKLYGVAGGAPGYAHLFSYDPKRGSFEDYGQPNFELVGEGLAPGITWRGFQLSALAASEDGRTIVLGDDEALSQLMVFPVSLSSEKSRVGVVRLP